LLIAARADEKRTANSAKTFQTPSTSRFFLGGRNITSLLILRLTAVVTFNSYSVYMALGFFEVPLLVSSAPYLSFSAVTAYKWFIYVEIR